MEVKGQERVKEVAKKFSLPSWWVEEVMVEYCDCRVFAQGGDICRFDFNLVPQTQIDEIPSRQILITSMRFMQNIRYDDFKGRGLLPLIGLPVTTLEDADLFPEGLVNKTGFPFGGGIGSWDPKDGFGFYAIVREGDYFYQWTISESLPLPGKHYHWYKSVLFDLEPLLPVHEAIQKYRNMPEVKDGTASSQIVSEILGLYAKLEQMRAGYREMILEYHNKRKQEFDIADWDVPDPPRLSYFETLKPVRNDKGKIVFKVRTHLEPLLLRAAVRHYNAARKAHESRKKDPDNHDLTIDEIEHSTMCIVAAANCLESYINHIFEKHLPEDSSSFESSPALPPKWLYASAMLNPQNSFKASDYPFSDFKRIVRLRNGIIHHRPEFIAPVGETSKAMSEYNVENSALAIKVVSAMVTQLSDGSKVQLPAWIRTTMGSAAYWDEVRDCLKELTPSVVQ